MMPLTFTVDQDLQQNVRITLPNVFSGEIKLQLNIVINEYGHMHSLKFILWYFFLNPRWFLKKNSILQMSLP